MTIPALSTSDKSFICSYTLGFNIHPILASGIMNEITTYTTEYIEGACWIPVLAPLETSDHSYFWDECDKDMVYVRVGCRVSIDGYIHTWLLSDQKNTELILWNNKASSVGTPINDTTTLHWTIEKIYRQVIGNTAMFVRTNVKFQVYVTGATRLYLCGVNSTATVPNILLDPADVIASHVAWFPNNTVVNISDLLTSNNDSSSPKCSLRSVSEGSLGISTVAMGTSPDFWYVTGDHVSSIGISAICSPGNVGYAYKSLCNAGVSGGIGNNSGRSYTVSRIGAMCIGCASGVSWAQVMVDQSPNQSYIWVDSYCSGASGSGPTECANNGGTWIPGHYECNPSFTYDTSVSFTYSKWNSISPTISDFAAGRFYFSSLDDGHSHSMQAEYTTTSFIDMFSEYEDDDRDWLKHFEFVPYVHLDIYGVPTTPPYNNYFYTEYVKVIGIGVLTNNNGATIGSADWIITWSGVNYFDSWISPDGLNVRDPGSSEPLLTRPVTHHEGFYTGATDIEGGFLFEPVTSDAFLSRNPGTETKSLIPQNYNTGFDFLYIPITSNGFLSRDPGIETKIMIPLSNNCGFSWLYKPTTSQCFRSRDPGTETKIGIPLSNNCGFSWLYELIKPQISILYHLKTDGNDELDGLSWDNAWKHWTYMAQNMPGDYPYTVLVEEGVYNDNETQIGPDNSVVVYLVKGGLDDVAVVVVTLV